MSTIATTGTDSSKTSPRRDISFELKRIYRNRDQYAASKASKGSNNALDTIDFHLNGRNRYMKINQPSTLSSQQKLESELLVENRQWTRFKNPKLNRYDTLDQDDYKPKHYVFDKNRNPITSDDDDDDNYLEVNSRSGKLGLKKKKKPLNERNVVNNEMKKNEEEKAGKSSLKAKSKSINDLHSEDKKEEPPKLVEIKVKKEPSKQKAARKVVRKNSIGTSMTNFSTISTATNPEPIDEKKVSKAMKQIENIFKDSSTDAPREDEERIMRKEEMRIKGDEMTDKEKAQYLKDKNIQVNLSTQDSDESHKLVKKPEKNRNFVRDDLVTTGTQTPRQVNTLYLW
jgi:hypothetical protein